MVSFRFNIIEQKSLKTTYIQYCVHFPVNIPLKIVHVDVYMADIHQYFNGNIAILVLADHISLFVVIEPLKILNTEQYSKTL